MTAERPFAAPQGARIFSTGQPCPGFVILERGAIRVTLTGPSGREVVLYRVRPGEVCLQTLSCLIDGKPYAAEGVAETEVAGKLTPAHAFRSRLAEDAAFRDLIMASIATRFGEYQQLVEDVALSSFDARLAKALLRLADAQGHVAATHAELAVETASGRAYVSRRLGAFARRGLIAQCENGLLLRDAAALERIVADPR